MFTGTFFGTFDIFRQKMLFLLHSAIVTARESFYKNYEHCCRSVVYLWILFENNIRVYRYIFWHIWRFLTKVAVFATFYYCYSWEIILQELKTLLQISSLLMNTFENEISFYRHIFWHIWRFLAKVAVFATFYHCYGQEIIH